MLIFLKTCFSRIGLLLLALTLVVINPRCYSQVDQEPYDCLLITNNPYRYAVLDLRSGLMQSNPFPEYERFNQWLPEGTSPDGRYRAFFRPADLWATTFDLVVEDYETSTTVTILEDAAELNRVSIPPQYQLSWSPDSEWVAFSRMFMDTPENYLVIFKPDGSQIFRSNRSVSFLAWSTDSQYLVLLEMIQIRELQIDVWSSEAADIFTTYPIPAKKTIDAIVWSPSANVFAFLESDSDWNLPTSSSLNIVAVETSAHTVFPLQSDLRLILGYDPELLWSPDGEYLALRYGYLDQIVRVQIFPANGADPIDVVAGEEIIHLTWAGNGALLYWTKDELHRTDLNVFDPVSQATTFLWDTYSSHFIFQNTMLIEWFDEGGFNVELVDFSENEHLPILTGVEDITSNFSHDPSGSFFYLWADENSEVWLTKVTPGDFQVQTQPLNISSLASLHWFHNSNRFAYSSATEGEHQVGIVDAFSGRDILSFSQLPHQVKIAPYWSPTSEEVGFTSFDNSGNTWLDLYRSDGTHLYRLHAADNIDSIIPSPSQDVWAITTSTVTVSADIPLYSLSLRLSRPDEPDSDIIRSDLSEISYVSWSPDGERLAFSSVDQDGVRRIEVVTQDGQDVQAFVDVRIPRYGDLEWAYCDALQ